MLSLACRRFRARFSPGEPDTLRHRHRQSCAACALYAAAMEKAAAPRLPLPGGLQGRLRAIARPEMDREPKAVLPFPLPKLPQRPLPEGLRERLRAIPFQAGARKPEPPPWILSPRYAVAASYLLAVLGMAVLGGPVAAGLEKAQDVGREVKLALSQTGEAGRERIEKLEDVTNERYGEARRSLSSSLESLRSGWTDLTAGLLSGDEDRNPGPRGESSGS